MTSFMKHIIVSFLLMGCFALSSLQAQTEKGLFIIGAGSSADLSNTHGGLSASPSSSVTTISIKPEVAYTIMDDLSVGLSVSVLGYTKGPASAHTILLSEFKYFFKGTNFRPFVKANVGYKYEDLSGAFGQKVSVNDVHGIAFGGGIGGAFFVRNNISIDLGLDYLHSNLKRVSQLPPTDGVWVEENPLKVKMDDINIFIGFSVYL